MIEYWAPKSRKATEFSPDELSEALKEALEVEPQELELEIKAKSIIDFLERMHATPGVDGVAISFVKEPPAPSLFYIRVLAPLQVGREDSSRIVETVTDADAEFAEKLDGIMCSGMGICNSRNLDPRSFVTTLKRSVRTSKTEKIAGVFIFKRDNS